MNKRTNKRGEARRSLNLRARRKLTDAEALTLFKEVAAEVAASEPRPSRFAGPSFADHILLKRLEDEGFQRLYIEQYRENAARRNKLLWEIMQADQLLVRGDIHGRAASLAVLDALTAYAGVAGPYVVADKRECARNVIVGAAIEYLRSTLRSNARVSSSILNAEFEGRLAGLVEVMSWALKGRGGARAAYAGKNKISKKVIEWAKTYTKHAGIHWGVLNRTNSLDDTTGESKVRSVYGRVKKFDWERLLRERSFVDADLGDLPVERLAFLDIVRWGRWAQQNGEDLLKRSLEFAEFYFSTERLPPPDENVSDGEEINGQHKQGSSRLPPSD